MSKKREADPSPEEFGSYEEAADFWDAHREFLKTARKKDCFIKIVVTNKTARRDIEKAVDLISSIDKHVLLVLQPVWADKKQDKVRTRVLFDYLFLAEKKLANVRVMPQMHKILGIT